MTAERFDQRTLENMEVDFDSAKRRPPRAKAHCARDLGSGRGRQTGRTTIAPLSTSKAIAGHHTLQSSNFSSSMTSVTTVLQSPAVRW
jgi:hypothetical protein